MAHDYEEVGGSGFDRRPGHDWFRLCRSRRREEDSPGHRGVRQRSVVGPARGVSRLPQAHLRCGTMTQMVWESGVTSRVSGPRFWGLL
jgi:hypothetical protein